MEATVFNPIQLHLLRMFSRMNSEQELKEVHVQMKIVLDTNCLIPVLIPGSYGHDIWQAFRTGQYTPTIISSWTVPSPPEPPTS